eukprot:305073-Pleurochrysis_carterae.AAC.2
MQQILYGLNVRMAVRIAGCSSLSMPAHSPYEIRLDASQSTLYCTSTTPGMIACTRNKKPHGDSSESNTPLRDGKKSEAAPSWTRVSPLASASAAIFVPALLMLAFCLRAASLMFRRQKATRGRPCADERRVVSDVMAARVAVTQGSR